MQIIKSVQNRIYKVRGVRVMLDFDLADLYEVPTKALNQAVKRNDKRFPEDFMFRLTELEWESMRSQFVTASTQSPLKENIIIYQSKRNKAVLPFAFTEQGIAMLSGILHSDKAIKMNIAIMRAFVEIRRIVFQQTDLKTQLLEIKQQLGEHDAQLNQLYDAMENLLDKKAAQKKWEERERIGFKK